VGNVFFLRLIVEVFHALTGNFLVLAEVEVAAGGNTFELLHAERERKHHIHARAGVVRQFFLPVFVHAELARRQADGLVPFQAFGDPRFVPVGVGAGLDEELQFHLLEFPAAEGEVARVDFVAERFADLGDAKRNLLAGNAQDILELNKNHLGGFGTEVDLVGVILYRPGMGLEHEIELPGLGVVVRSAFGTLGLRQLVGAPTTFAFFAIHHGVAEGRNVARGFPHARVRDDRAVNADDIGAPADGVVPPRVADVAFEFGAHRAVVPEAVDAAVDFAGLEDKAAPFAERDDLVHEIDWFGVRHSEANYGERFPASQGYGGFVLALVAPVEYQYDKIV